LAWSQWKGGRGGDLRPAAAICRFGPKTLALRQRHASLPTACSLRGIVFAIDSPIGHDRCLRGIDFATNSTRGLDRCLRGIDFATNCPTRARSALDDASGASISGTTAHPWLAPRVIDACEASISRPRAYLRRARRQIDAYEASLSRPRAYLRRARRQIDAS
jgi:hypothetical protein